MSIIDGEYDDMDSYDWVEFIDEYHCPDYWYDLDSFMDDGCFPDSDECDDTEEGDCGEDSIGG